MKGDEPASAECPACGQIVHATPSHSVKNGTISTRNAIRKSMLCHLKNRHHQLDVRERTEIADMAAGTLEAFA